MQFGYLSLSKRRVQRVPGAGLRDGHSDCGTRGAGYVFAVPATERSYLPLAREGKETPIPPIRRVARPTRSAERVAAI
jgi:hypothetical protein